jgi:hypothetical protein
VSTTKILSQRRRALHSHLLAKEFPAGGEVAGWTCKFEVVYVNDEKQVQFRVEVARTPIRDGGEAHRDQMAVAVLFPVSSRIWVAV